MSFPFKALTSVLEFIYYHHALTIHMQLTAYGSSVELPFTCPYLLLKVLLMDKSPPF